jgi:hypothetical protein
VQCTGINGNLVQPQCLLLPVLSFPTPTRDLRLSFVVPHFLIATLGLDALGALHAKRSHFVGELGRGRGLVRGSCVVGGGSWGRWLWKRRGSVG